MLDSFHTIWLGFLIFIRGYDHRGASSRRYLVGLVLLVLVCRFLQELPPVPPFCCTSFSAFLVRVIFCRAFIEKRWIYLHEELHGIVNQAVDSPKFYSVRDN